MALLPNVCRYPAAPAVAVGDLTIPLLGADRVVEVKVRGRGFQQLYTWLDGRDLLIVRADRCEPLVVLPLKLAVEIAKTAERGKNGTPTEQELAAAHQKAWAAGDYATCTSLIRQINRLRGYTPRPHLDTWDSHERDLAEEREGSNR